MSYRGSTAEGRLFSYRNLARAYLGKTFLAISRSLGQSWTYKNSILGKKGRYFHIVILVSFLGLLT